MLWFDFLSYWPLLLNIRVNLLFIKDVINSSKIHFIGQSCHGLGNRVYFFIFSFFFARGKVTSDLIKWVPALINTETMEPSVCASACYRSVIMMLSQQSCFRYSSNQLEMRTILRHTRTDYAFADITASGRQIRRRPTFTLNNWDYPASPSDVTACQNTLETSKNAHRLTSRLRITLLQHRAVGLNECLKGQIDILANSLLPPPKLMENTNKLVAGLQFVFLVQPKHL